MIQITPKLDTSEPFLSSDEGRVICKFCISSFPPFAHQLLCVEFPDIRVEGQEKKSGPGWSAVDWFSHFKQENLECSKPKFLDAE